MIIFSKYGKLHSSFSGKLRFQVDWTLFLFLVLLMNVKLWVKIIALIFIYVRRFNFRFEFSWKSSRLPLFYPAVIFIGVINWIFCGLYSNLPYGLVLISGLLFWIFCILVIHQLKLTVDHTPESVLHNTLFLFFFVNVLVSVLNLLLIIIETSAWNPYRFQGMYQKYFIGTGDFIKGLPFDTSTTNALINAFGVVYFLNRKKIIWMMGCMITLLITGSNLTNILLIAALTFSFFMQSDRNQKSQITLCIFLMIIFLGRVSPQNDHYVLSAVEKMFNIPEENPDEGLNPEGKDSAEQKKIRVATLYLDSLRNSWSGLNYANTSKISWKRPEIPQPDINTASYQSRMDTTELQTKLMAFRKTHYAETAWFQKSGTVLPGKIIALQETLHFLKTHPSRIITGTGAGNFSSKLAFRVSGLNIAGKYPEVLAYIHPYFLENHLRLYLYYFTQHKDVHSIIHTPDSVLNQLSGEYGLAGISCFFFFYLGWFVARVKKKSFSIPLLIIMTGAFLTGYWFEQLSVVILFELLMLMDIKLNGKSIFLKKKKLLS